MDLNDKLIARFWAKVDKNGPVPEHVPELGPCWIWTGKVDRDGYARIRFGPRANNHKIGVHRLAILISGREIPEGMCGLHRCDRPICVNPDHLFVGTNADNSEDCVRKGRIASGDRSGLRLHPERAARGDRNGSRTHPERLARGDRSGSRLHPERVARGDRNGAVTHPEKLTRGDRHWTRINPGKIPRGKLHGSHTKPDSVPRGERHGNAKLTEEIVRNIRERRGRGDRPIDIARDIGVHRSVIWFVYTRRTWGHVD